MDVLTGPCKAFAKVLEDLSRLGGITGLNILHPDYSPNNKLFKFVVIVMVSYVFVVINTCNAESGDFVATVFRLVNFGQYVQVGPDESTSAAQSSKLIKLSKFQGCMKIYMFVYHRRTQILQLSNSFHAIYHRNMEHQQRREILDRFVGLSRFSWIVIRNLYLTICPLIGLSPLVVGFLLQRRILPFGLIVPFVDPSSYSGTIVNYIYNLIFIFISTPGLAASEAFYVMHVALGVGHLHMMMGMLRDLQELLQKKQQDARGDVELEKLIEVRLKELIYEHQDHFR